MAKQINIAPNLTYALSEISSISLNYSYAQATYDKTTNSYLSNYNYQQVSGTYNYLYTEKDKLNLTLSGSQYDKPMNANNNNTVSNYSLATNNNQAQIGWQHSFPEHWVSYLAVGMNYSQSDLTQVIPPHLTFKPSALDPKYFPFTLTPEKEVSKSTTGTGQIYQASIQKHLNKAHLQ